MTGQDGTAASRTEPEEPPDYVGIYVANKQARRQLGHAPRVLARAIRLVWESGRLLLVTTGVLVLLSAVLLLAQVYLVRETLQRLLDSSGDSTVLLPVIGLLVALLIASRLLGAAQALLQRLLGERATYRATSYVVDVTSRVPLRAFEDHTFFHHLVRVEQNGLSKPVEVVQAIVLLLAGGVSSALLLGYVATVDPVLIPMLLITAAPSYTASRAEGRAQFSFALSMVDLLRRRTYVQSLLGSVQAAKELRAFESEPYLRRRWDDMWDDYLAGLRDLTSWRLSVMAMGTLASGLLVALVGLFLVYRLESGYLGIAEAGAAVLALRLLSGRALETAKGMAGVLEARPFLEDLETFLERYGAEAETPGTADVPAPHRIQLRGASFRYPQAEREAVSGVDLDIEAGQVVALVGENGSGKTTLAMMLAALHAPTSGALVWDGRELTRDELATARQHVCVVFQDFVRYALQARENVALTEPESDEGVLTAVRAAGADFLLDLPQGLDTVLSKEYAGGRDLSVGQWQRVALARAYFRDSPVVILDEPTSALDARAEYELFKRLRSLWRGRTVVFISHRLSSARAADRVVVLHHGVVVEQGTHDELMSARGSYEHMYSLQAEAYRDTLTT